MSGDIPNENPFADSSIQEAAVIDITPALENYNPFNKVAISPSAPVNETSVQTQSLLDYQKKQAELERKEIELAHREEQLRQYSAQISNSNYQCDRVNNWPPLPKACGCIKPCFYQDIEIDIPLEFQKIVKQVYDLWLFHGIILLLNALGGIVLGSARIILFSVLNVLFFVPFSYVCWFRPLYKAFRSDSSINFMIFFFTSLFQFMISTYQAVGLPNSGTIGVITMMEVIHHSFFTDILLLIISVGFVCAAITDVVLFVKVHRIYRSTGASLANAQLEFTQEFLNRPSVFLGSFRNNGRY